MNKTLKKVIIIIISIISIFAIIFFTYFAFYYHTSKVNNTYLQSSDKVTITNDDNYIYFDGSGEDNAIIFYPGAKVESKSYARIMYKLSENGIDCFLLKLPFNFAFFGIKYPDKIIKEYNYENIYLAGHSLGGVAASIYASKNDNITGLIFLASYPSTKLDNNLKVLSIYGSNDEVLNKKSYKNASWPTNTKEYIIDGGNHSGFANYGKQKGDGKSTISKTEQQDETVKIIINELLGSN